MMAAASRRRSSSYLKPALLRRRTEAIGARVLPIEMNAAASGVGPIGRLTAKAAIAIAGQSRMPITSIAATAMPVGGQTGVT